MQAANRTDTGRRDKRRDGGETRGNIEYFGKYIEYFAKYSISSDFITAPSQEYAETIEREVEESSNRDEKFANCVENFL